MKKIISILFVFIVISACKKTVAENYRSAVVGTYVGNCILLNNNNGDTSFTNAAVQVLIDHHTDNTVIFKGDILDISTPGGSHIVAINDTFAFAGGRFKGDSLIYITPDYTGDFTGLYFLKKGN